MPIYKYRSFEEAEKHLGQLLPSDPLQKFSRLQLLLRGLMPTTEIQRGIFKFKTIEDANRHRERASL